MTAVVDPGTPIVEQLVRELLGTAPDLASGEVLPTGPTPGAHAATPELTPCTPVEWFGPPVHTREDTTAVMPAVDDQQGRQAS